MTLAINVITNRIVIEKIKSINNSIKRLIEIINT